MGSDGPVLPETRFYRVRNVVVNDGRTVEPSSAPQAAWHALAAADVIKALRVDPDNGLSSAQAARRLQQHGPNRLVEAPREPRWRAFLRQLQDLLILILLAAAVVSLVVTRTWETPIAIAVVVLLNATIGFVQESRAEASLDALRRMSVTTATVRRDGRIVRLDAADLVPGDVIVVQAGDRVPADGRLLTSTSVEVSESVLTGEAHPVTKSATAEVQEAAPLGERTTVVFMNTSVTPGRGEALVTATGMRTEMGRIADLLRGAEPAPTPLQRQINALSRTLAVIAGAVIIVVLALGIARRQELSALFVSAVSLAVAAIPEGLPAVVAFTLAMGSGRPRLGTRPRPADTSRSGTGPTWSEPPQRTRRPRPHRRRPQPRRQSRAPATARPAEPRPARPATCQSAEQPRKRFGDLPAALTCLLGVTGGDELLSQARPSARQGKDSGRFAHPATSAVSSFVCRPSRMSIALRYSAASQPSARCK